VLRWVGPSEHAAPQLLERDLAWWREGTCATFAICDPEDCVGCVWIDLEPSERGEVGYWLLPQARGKGLATRSVQLVSRWALQDLQLARLSLCTEPANERSQRVAERSGFVREGVLRSYREVGGRRVDCVIFSLLPIDVGADQRVR
jgi:ribosomal-protein-alanine N-acetyltransferase